eukprot:XP_011440976.2 PREDICTED: angiopoietin-1 [Crassostrea gigas]
MSDSVDQLCWHPKNPDQLVTASGDKTIRIWDARTNRSVATVNTKGENINICRSPDGSTITVNNKDDLITFIDVRSHRSKVKEPFKFEVSEISWNNDGDLFFLTSGQGSISILSYPDLKLQHTLNAHPADCICIEFDPKEKYFATGSADALVSNVESLLKLTPWNWKHLNSSFKVDTPVTVDVSLTSHYRLTGKHLNKYLIKELQKQRDCASILKAIPNTKGRNGVYTIYPDMTTKKLVYCDMTTDGGGWTVIQRRMDGSEKFDLSWQTYKDGFGKPQGEYWLGNEDIHLLTARTSQELRVDLQKFSGEKAYAKYSTFTVLSESQKYKLTVGGYSGTAGNDLEYNNGGKFSTRDQDNDRWSKHCGVEFQGGWWFKQCTNAYLNGPYQKYAKTSGAIIVWYKFGNEHRALKRASMMIRPKI